MRKDKGIGPRVLILDIETAPILGYVWGLFDQNVGLNQVKEDWHLLSWSAKWLDDPKVMYMDQRNVKNIENDKVILLKLWDLLDEADIVIGQNSKSFDHKKINARFIMHGMQPPSTYRHIDTMGIAKKHFAFTSNKLEYMTNKLCTKYKKLKTKQFPGFTLWSECLKGNVAAFREMELYNRMDVLSTEELYYKLVPWDSAIDFSVYYDDEAIVCACGSEQFKLNGYAYTSTGKFQRHKCNHCGRETRSSVNLLTKEKRASLPKGTTRS